MKFKTLTNLLLLIFGSITSTLSVAAPNVLVTIPPIHSMVAAISDGVFEPKLLLNSLQSPHDFQLKPSQRSDINQAEVIIWVGQDMESALKKIINDQDAMILTLSDAPSASWLPYRDWGSKENHDDHEIHEDHDSHTSHSQEEHDSHHEEHHPDGDHESYYEKHHGAHQHTGSIDPHFWLDPLVMSQVARWTTELLANQDPQNAKQYRINLEQFIKTLEPLMAQPTSESAVPVVALHDGFQYFEKLAGIETRAVVFEDGEHAGVSVKHLSELRETIKQSDILCALSEPQLPSRQLERLKADLGLKLIPIDALGYGLPVGKTLYVEMMKNNLNQISACTKN